MLSYQVQPTSTVVNVAVAVIHYQEQYLLGFRNQTQHQGNRYEFVGGKIDANETAKEALIREVSEETGIDIKDNVAVKLGRLHHDYGDKHVCLQVYQVALTEVQFAKHQYESHGLEGQPLVWADKNKLLAGDYPLPAANQTILAWLQLPIHLVITYPLAHFSDQSNATAAWLAYQQQHLPQDAWVYIRMKASTVNEQSQEIMLIKQLMDLRPDINGVLPNHHISQMLTTDNQDVHQAYNQSYSHIKSGHLTHTELMQWFSDFKKQPKSNQKDTQSLSIDQPLIISCHDTDSIHAANQLAATRLKNQQPPVIGMLLSPVLATQSHPNDAPLGWEAWSALAQLADVPVIALGGLSPTMLQHATQYGATSIAGIREFLKD